MLKQNFLRAQNHIFPHRQSKQSKCDLASADRHSENVIIEAIIVPKLELRNVKMQVLFADVVESADDPALDDRPKALDRVGVNCTDDILLCGMVNGGVRISLFAQAVITNPLVGAEQN